MTKALNVLLVAQTPPPHYGQAVMMQHIATGHYRGVAIHHVRMAFSQDMRQVGKFSVRKLFHLLGVIAKVAVARFRFNASVLYYPPSGPRKIPMYRDIAVLLATRWMFKKTIFHFEAGGLSELYPALPRWVKPFFRAAYFGADVGIRLDRFTPEDPITLHARTEVIIPNAVDDAPSSVNPVHLHRPWVEPSILYAGILRESKGVLVLLEACARLRAAGKRFGIRLMGEFESGGFEQRARTLAAQHELPIEWLGFRTGAEKDAAYSEADIFCFPSFFDSESGPVVLVEAMQFRLPIVSTLWRGIPGMVTDGYNGFLVPPHDAAPVADRLARLIADQELARRMGAAGRAVYESRFTLRAFHQNLQEVFELVRD